MHTDPVRVLGIVASGAATTVMLWEQEGWPGGVGTVEDWDRRHCKPRRVDPELYLEACVQKPAGAQRHRPRRRPAALAQGATYRLRAGTCLAPAHVAPARAATGLLLPAHPCRARAAGGRGGGPEAGFTPLALTHQDASQSGAACWASHARSMAGSGPCSWWGPWLAGPLAGPAKQ